MVSSFCELVSASTKIGVLRSTVATGPEGGHGAIAVEALAHQVAEETRDVAVVFEPAGAETPVDRSGDEGVGVHVGVDLGDGALG